eukprot:5234925-Amphidinium_carterae.1
MVWVAGACCAVCVVPTCYQPGARFLKNYSFELELKFNITVILIVRIVPCSMESAYPESPTLTTSLAAPSCHIRDDGRTREGASHQ